MQVQSTYKKYSSLYGKLKQAREEMKIEEATNRVNYYSDYLEDYIQNIQYINPSQQKKTTFDQIEKGVLSTAFYEETISQLTEYKKLKDDLNKPFKIFIIGSGNYGKSTLINSLLGGNYAVTDIIPKTWKIDVYNKTTDSNLVVLHYKDGSKKKLTRERALQIIDEEEEKVEEANRKIRKILRQSRREKKYDSVQAENEYKEKVQNEMGYTPKINEVHWGIPNNGLLDNLILVDTPGLDQKNFSGEVIHNIETFSDQSDGIIWIMDATSIDARVNDTALFNDLLQSLEDQQNAVQTENIIAVINKMDLVANSTEEKEAVIHKANASYKNRFEKIVPYSDLIAYEENTENDEVKRRTSGYYDLLAVIEDVFLKNATTIQTDRGHKSCTNYNQKTLNRIEVFHHRLVSDHDKLIEGLEATGADYNTEAERLSVDFNQLINHEFNKMQHQLTRHLERVSKIENEAQKESYIRRNIYQEDTIKASLHQFVTQAEKTAKKLYDSILRKYMVTQYKHLNTFRNLPAIPTPKFESKIKTGEIYMPKVLNSAAVGGAIGMIFGGVGAAIGAGLGGLFSSWARSEQLTEIENKVWTYYSEMYDVYTSLVYEYFNEVIAILFDHLLTSFANVYNLTAYLDDADVFDDLVDRLFTTNEFILEQYSNQDIAFAVPLPEIILTY